MKHIAPLDGLRGIAVLLVLLQHSVDHFPGLAPNTRLWLHQYANGGLGVQLFFVLSGYLITRLLLRERERYGRISLRHFYFRRALRIFPAFLAYLVVVIWWAQTQLTASPSALGWSLAAGYLWNYHGLFPIVDLGDTWLVGHTWTLALEQQFYLLWPLGLILLRSPRGALYGAIAVVVWCPLARIGSYFLFPELRGHITMMLHTSADGLMAGAAIAVLSQNDSVRGWLTRHGASAAAVFAGWALIVSPALGLLLPGYGVVLGLSLDAVAAGLVILWAQQSSGGAIATALSRGPLPWLGAISYSVYLWQQPWLAEHGLIADGHVWLAWLGILTCGTISYFAIERPMLSLKRLYPRA